MSIPNNIVESLYQKGIDIVSSMPVTGGDINQARQLTTSDNRQYFIKFNSTEDGASLLQSELNGVRIFKEEGLPTINCIAHDLKIKTPYLLMDWIETFPRSKEKLALALYDVHSKTASGFGFDHQGYIGTLVKKAGWRDRFSACYIELRIEQLLRAAFDKGYKIRVSLDALEEVIDSEFPIESPSLIHGDLWSGNLIDSHDGPVFIDPSVEYSHRELDLAMMRLFGGFSSQVFELYHDHFPLATGWEDRADLLQLYYLLVHLNLFGGAYFDPTRNIIRKYLS